MGIKDVAGTLGIGYRIKKLRTSQGLSQKEFAEKIHIPVSTLSNYENGNRIPGFGTLDKIATALHVKPSDLLGLNPDRSIIPDQVQKKPVKVISDKQKSRLDEAYNKLNQTGQKEAVKRVEELTQIDKYKLSNDSGKE